MTEAAREAETGTWCVYRAEWVRWYVSKIPGWEGHDDCLKVLRDKFTGMLREGDWRVLRIGVAPLDRWRLDLRLPTLKGEWKTRADADRHSGLLGPDAVVVPWGSAQERELMDYGRKPLAG